MFSRLLLIGTNLLPQFNCPNPRWTRAPLHTTAVHSRAHCGKTHKFRTHSDRTDCIPMATPRNVVHHDTYGTCGNRTAPFLERAHKLGSFPIHLKHRVALPSCSPWCKSHSSHNHTAENSCIPSRTLGNTDHLRTRYKCDNHSIPPQWAYTALVHLRTEYVSPIWFRQKPQDYA